MPTRQYRDPSGTQWEVFEVRRLSDRPTSVRPALVSGWLAFVSESERRRLPRYPADWLERSDDELHELLADALVVPEPSRQGRQMGGEPPVEAGTGVHRRDRPNRPRLRPPSAAEPFPFAESTTGSSHPVAPPTLSGVLGLAEIETLVRAHARQARGSGVAVIEGMIGVKRALSERGADVSPDALKLLRKVFVDEFYFPASE